MWVCVGCWAVGCCQYYICRVEEGGSFEGAIEAAMLSFDLQLLIHFRACNR